MSKVGNSFDDQKESYVKPVLSKYEYDLYKEEEDVEFPVVSIKYTGSPNSNEKWKVLEAGKIAVVLEGSKISKKEKIFLRTSEGVKLLLSLYKSGKKTIAFLRAGIKKGIKKP